jgi:lysylphosphatidylglycerol synthetase-like protein (DUF2156 family)
MNGFDLASHLFAALPLYMAYVTEQTYLLYFTIITTLISLVYHIDENNISLHLDEFASCALIVVTFMTYVNDVYKPTYIALGLLLVVVLVDYYAELDIINFYVGLTVFVALLIFIYERQTLEELPQRLKVKDAYFISFIMTQCLAVAFFLWDKDPYAHSLWHLFAFVSLGSAIAHIHEKDEDVKRKVFYVLGSIPSRLFISAILIHWTTAENPDNLPVAIGTLILAAVLLIKPVRDMWTGERSYFLLLHGISYIAIAVFMFVNMENNVLIAGIWLILDTIVSGYMWYNRRQVVKTTTTPKYKKLQLQNLRF